VSKVGFKKIIYGKVSKTRSNSIGVGIENSRITCPGNYSHQIDHRKIYGLSYNLREFSSKARVKIIIEEVGKDEYVKKVYGNKREKG